MRREVIDYKPIRDFWNIAKGVGIIAIVIGHTCIGFASNFVYMFHLQFFFFISGFLYSEIKYGNDPWLNMKNKIKSLWLPYFLIISFFVIFHNLFLILGLQLQDTSNLSLTEILVRVCEAMFGYSEEILAGPTWFLRTLAMAMIIFGFIVFISRIIERKSSLVVKIFFQLVCVVALTVVGYPLILNHIQLPADMQISFEVMPFIWVGYILRNYKGDVEKFLNPIVAVIAFVIVGVVSVFKSIDFAYGSEFPYMHLISLLGIYGCLYIAKLIRKFKASTKIMAFVGELSLYIMFLHFFILRIIDRIICNIKGDPTGDLFGNLPVAFEELWWLYLIVCIPVSVLLGWVIKKCSTLIKRACTNQE